MYRDLYQYLISNQQLQIPGIGNFQIERTPAQTDFPNKVIHAAGYSIRLRSLSETNSRQFYNWLADLLHISEREAIVRFNDFVFELQKRLSSGESIDWKGVGSLTKDQTGTINFLPSPVEFDFNGPVTAHKVLREKAEHKIRVGEEERTSVQMTEILAQPGSERSYWWVYALAAGIIIFIFTGWYLSEHGVDSYGISNKQKLSPKQNSATYRELNNP
jgi:nucleoid DNA-binding protein